MSIITERALIKRINRKLAHTDEAIRICREDSRWIDQLGRHFIEDTKTKFVLATDCDLADIGREVGVLGVDDEVHSA